jgi:hypothetical protein
LHCFREGIPDGFDWLRDGLSKMIGVDAQKRGMEARDSRGGVELSGCLHSLNPSCSAIAAVSRAPCRDSDDDDLLLPAGKDGAAASEAVTNPSVSAVDRRVKPGDDDEKLAGRRWRRSGEEITRWPRAR